MNIISSLIVCVYQTENPNILDIKSVFLENPKTIKTA